MEESSGGVVLGVVDEYHTWLMWIDGIVIA